LRGVAEKFFCPSTTRRRDYFHSHHRGVAQQSRIGHFGIKGVRREVVTVRPCRGAEFDKDAGELSRIPQRFQHRPVRGNDVCEIALAETAVRKAQAQAMAAERLGLGNFDQRQFSHPANPGCVRAGGSFARAPNFPATEAGAQATGLVGRRGSSCPFCPRGTLIGLAKRMERARGKCPPSLRSSEGGRRGLLFCLLLLQAFLPALDDLFGIEW